MANNYARGWLWAWAEWTKINLPARSIVAQEEGRYQGREYK